jgi:hypothetical protein
MIILPMLFRHTHVSSDPSLAGTDGEQPKPVEKTVSVKVPSPTKRIRGRLLKDEK